MNRPDTLSTRSSCTPISTTAGSFMPNTPAAGAGRRGRTSPTNAGDADAEARGDVHRLIGALRLPRAEVLAGNRRRRSHESHRCPRDEREQLRVGDRERRLRRRALRQRPDKREHQHAADVHGDALNTRRQSEPEQRPDDLPVRTVPVPRGNDTTHPPPQSFYIA